MADCAARAEGRHRRLRWGFWLLALAVLGAGLGLRDPWPPDEPRFAMIAADMAAGGDWLFPHAGPFLYADKPPLFLWLTALGLLLGLPISVAPWLPGLAGSLLALWCTVDLGTRLWGRRTGLVAGCCLLAALQFPLQAQSAQLDASLVGWTTLGLYALLRVLLLNHWPGWLAVAGLAMGLGVITKGVGFLPLFLLPAAWWWARRNAVPGWRRGHGWWLLPLGLFVPVLSWAGAVLGVAFSSGNPELLAYAREIFLGQTAGRYADAGHHYQHPLYFVVEVIPTLWLPLAALLPWLLPAWWRRLRRGGDARLALPLLWVVLVLLFFSGSSGKRGVYILPALPALALASAPLLPALLRRRGPRRLAAGLLVAAPLLLAAACVALAVRPELLTRQNDDLAEVAGGLLLLGSGGAALAAGIAGVGLLRARLAPFLLWAVMLAGLTVSHGVVRPLLDPALSARAFMAEVGRRSAGRELGMVAWKEQMWLFRPGPLTVFAHRPRTNAARHRELAAGLAWVGAKPERLLLLPADLILDLPGLQPFVTRRPGDDLGRRHRERWLLIDGSQLTEQGRLFALSSPPAEPDDGR